MHNLHISGQKGLSMQACTGSVRQVGRGSEREAGMHVRSQREETGKNFMGQKSRQACTLGGNKG
jgi:hypothetical protein